MKRQSVASGEVRGYRSADGLSLDDVPGRIRQFRAYWGLSQVELGVLCGVDRAAIRRWETSGPGRMTALVVLAMHALQQRASTATATATKAKATRR